MNSSYAAARQRESTGFVPAGLRRDFSAVLRSTPAEEEAIEIPADDTGAPTPARSRNAQASQQGGEAPATSTPAEAPSRSRSAQSEDAPVVEGPRSRVPHFSSVPESVQFPKGPYRQAPAEHGGEWWLTSPFTGPEPWLTQGFGDPYAVAGGDAAEAPPEFLAVFGPRPSAETHPNRMLRGAAVADWERNLEHFQGVGLPEGFTEEQLEAAGALFEQWGMGRPLLYNGRYGWTATFPSAQIPGYEASPFAALEAPHLVVARYQIEMTDRGMNPPEKHPFVPPQVFGDGHLSS
jgi:hypothetical protein